MITTLLFDLDGTLLPMDTSNFLEQYTREAAAHFAHIIPPDKFVKQLWESSLAMIANTDPQKTNMEAFIEYFGRHIGHPIEKLMPHFDHFYRQKFPKLKKFTIPSPVARQVIETALERGIEVVLATNPVFPLMAIEERMRWAGIHEAPFKLVTSYENMHFCKPQVSYYAEILEKIYKDPAECMMVGNDVDEDLIAAKLGMKTYLVTDYMLNNSGKKPEPDFAGTLSDLKEFVKKELPK